MSEKKEVAKPAKVTKKADIVTDIVSTFFKDEDGTPKEKRSFMNGDKLVREEIVND